mgnify:CR=1 FL=1|jgi:hypothetical protein
MKEVIVSYLSAALLNAGEIGYQGPTKADNVVLNIMNAVYFWLGAVAIGMIVYAGYIYVISDGDPADIKKAKDIILYALIGIVIVLLAFAITQIIVNGVG